MKGKKRVVINYYYFFLAMFSSYSALPPSRKSPSPAPPLMETRYFRSEPLKLVMKIFFGIFITESVTASPHNIRTTRRYGTARGHFGQNSDNATVRYSTWSFLVNNKTTRRSGMAHGNGELILDKDRTTQRSGMAHGSG